MKKLSLWLGMLCLSMLLAACGQAATLPAATLVPVGLPSATARASSPTPDPRPTRTPTRMPTQIPVPTQAVDYCVSCHTDKDTLVKNLKPAEVKPKESEGAG